MRGPRFHTRLADDAAQLNASIDFDQRLLPYDVAGSKAHARMLAAQGILSHADAEAIASGLDRVLEEWRRGELKLDAALEDVHMNVEKRLTELIGDAGARLHTARSRNDQVATDLRLYARDQARQLDACIINMQRALLAQAKAHVETLAPGYTHLQRAQPIRLAHHFLAYFEMLGRDRGRLRDAIARMNVSPLGSGALAATTFALDREAAARALDFDGVTQNSLDAVGDRDFAVELVAACALLMTHLSRLGEELVLWASQEFGFVKLPEDYCSGSSIMPQKVNPDVPELVRAKAGRVIGDLMTLLAVLKSLPLAYNKDLQETQEPLYDAVETALICTRTMTGLVAGAAFDRERMLRAVGQGHLLATEVADWLAARNVPFRVAHAAAGALVRAASARGVELAQLSLDDMRATLRDAGIDAAIDDGVFGVLDAARAVDRRDLPGGPARQRILQAIAAAEQLLGA
jgi:argininosuccinate lyase